MEKENDVVQEQFAESVAGPVRLVCLSSLFTACQI